MPDRQPQPVYVIENGYIRRTDDNSIGRRLRRWLKNPIKLQYLKNPKVAAGLIIGANVAIFLAWQRADGVLSDPSLDFLPRISLNTMRKHFLLNAISVHAGRWWTLVSHSFSHIDLFHLLRNMLELWQVAVPLGQIIGTLPMLIVYLSGAVAGGLTHIILNPSSNFPTFSMPSNLLGASGSVFALLALLTVLRPRQLVTTHLTAQPVPMWIGTGVIVALELVSLFAVRSHVSYASHFAGMAVGGLFGLYARNMRR